jgi:hypothetical protein
MAGRAAGHVTGHEASAVAERVARASYGRLVALLAASTRDIALAEDALADAFERALRTWPEAGVPDNPQGWLVTVARNRIRDLLTSAAARTAAPLPADIAATLAETDLDAIPDKRLELLFACAHPAIDPAVRTPLMLQVGRVLFVEGRPRRQALPRAGDDRSDHWSARGPGGTHGPGIGSSLTPPVWTTRRIRRLTSTSAMSVVMLRPPAGPGQA